MDAEKALELMEKDIKTVDSKTATLYGFAIDAMKANKEKPTVTQHIEKICDKVCADICKHNEHYAKMDTISEHSKLYDLCASCPLRELI